MLFSVPACFQGTLEVLGEGRRGERETEREERGRQQ